MSALAPGARIGPWTASSLLGQGGMGAVYRAKDASGREAAVKVLVRELAKDPRYVERFRREAQSAVVVSHRNIVSCLGSGEDGGTLWIAFELVPGGTLKDHLHEREKLPWREAARLAAEIARGLGAIHAKGLVHRDMKPANVLLDAEGVAKISDLGLARGLAGKQSLTLSGELLGTFEYVAPEQTEHAHVDFRADLYSFGVVLYELLTGERPFQGSGMMLIAQHITAVPRPPRELAPEVPRALDALVRRLLAKQPPERGDSALAVALELEAIASGQRTGSGPWRLLAGLGLAGALVAGVGFAATRPPRTETAAPPPGGVAGIATPVDPLVAAAPEWFREIDPRIRPKLPLPEPLVFGATRGEYVARTTSAVLLYVPALSVAVPGLKSDYGTNTFKVGAFFLGKHEVRNAEFDAFVRATGYSTNAESFTGHRYIRGADRATPWERTELTWRTPIDEGVPCVPDHPVVQVNWDDASAYVKWAKLGLPAMREWLAAAGWDPTRPGDGPLARIDVGSEPAGVLATRARSGKIVACGSTADDRTRAGFDDMAGNVREWVADPFVRDSVIYHHQCGGAWFHPDPATFADEDHRPTAGFGFRVALAARKER